MACWVQHWPCGGPRTHLKAGSDGTQGSYTIGGRDWGIPGSSQASSPGLCVNRQETLSQRRWVVKTSNGDCPLVSTHTPCHTCAHTCAQTRAHKRLRRGTEREDGSRHKSTCHRSLITWIQIPKTHTKARHSNTTITPVSQLEMGSLQQ